MSQDQASGVCGFCGNRSDKVVEGPSARYACLDCLLMSREVIAHLQRSHTCSFCLEDTPGSSLVQGPNGLLMCSSCVESGIKLLGG
jgi:hypothetical protein